MASMVQNDPSNARSPLTPQNGRRSTTGGVGKKQHSSSPNVNPLALKADWDDALEEEADMGMAKIGSPRPKSGKRSSGVTRVSELLEASAGTPTAPIAGQGRTCFTPSGTTAATRCQISRRHGVYTLLCARGTELLKAKHEMIKGKWTITDSAGAYVGKAATKGVEGSVYKFKQTDGSCVGGMFSSRVPVFCLSPDDPRTSPSRSP